MFSTCLYQAFFCGTQSCNGEALLPTLSSDSVVGVICRRLSICLWSIEDSCPSYFDFIRPRSCPLRHFDTNVEPMMDQMNGLPASPVDTPDNALSIGDTNSITHSTTSQLAGGSLNPRSCITCRRRKVKCNKQYPCSNCLKAHIDCIFPAPGRAPRRPRKPPDGELLARLRRLEGVVQSLGVQVDDDARVSGTSLGDSNAIDQAGLEYGSPNLGQTGPSGTNDQRRDSLTNGFGRLVVSEGRSRYINNRYWASLSNEVTCIIGTA